MQGLSKEHYRREPDFRITECKKTKSSPPQLWLLPAAELLE